MLIGHYGVSYAAKSLDRRIPLWLLFLATQFIDVLWGIFVLSGVERVRIVPGITASFPLDLVYMPYSHGLDLVLIWAAAVAVAYRALGPKPPSTRAAVIVGLVVLSHWLLDAIVHRPDLPLYDDVHKIGLGLWNHRALALLLELSLLLAGIFACRRAPAGSSPLGSRRTTVLVIVLVGVQLAAIFGPPPPSPAAAAVGFLLLYVCLALAAGWSERDAVNRSA